MADIADIDPAGPGLSPSQRAFVEAAEAIGATAPAGAGTGDPRAPDGRRASFPGMDPRALIRSCRFAWPSRRPYTSDRASR
jgi:hypothetical protein